MTKWKVVFENTKDTDKVELEMKAKDLQALLKWLEWAGWAVNSITSIKKIEK